MKRIAYFSVFYFLFAVSVFEINAQSDSLYTRAYLDKSTRFAWLTYGADLNFSQGGTTQLPVDGSLQNTSFGNQILPRLTIGGIHFWGHADFYVTFPLSFLAYQDVPEGLDELEIYQGVETGMRLYPLKLKPQSLVPFAGISFRRIRYSQESSDSGFNNGTPGYGRFIYPIQFGLTYTTNKYHISASGYWANHNEFNHFVSPTEQANVSLNPISFNISVLRYIDTDASLRSPKAASILNKRYQILKENNLLSAWFFGVGPSAALQTSKSPYLEQNFPYFYDEYAASVLPDLSFGYYFAQPDINANLTYRTFGNSYEGFDSEIKTRRHSFGIESTKYLFNWLGFVPFVGAAVTYENLSATVNGVDYRESKVAPGVVFGWDIRVTNTGTGVLRTNLRYYPNLHMNIEGEKMMFNHLEFNFIQWVQYIGRKKALSRKNH